MNAGMDSSSVATHKTDTLATTTDCLNTEGTHEAAPPRRLACPNSTLVPTDRGEEIDDHGLLQELWPRETQAQLNFQMTFPAAATEGNNSEEVQIDLPITQDLLGRKFENMIGNIVWDAAVSMHKYFQTKFPLGYFKDKVVLELGSGTGLVGMTLSFLGAKVHLTDLPKALPFLQHNVTACFTPANIHKAPYHIHTPTVSPYAWGKPLTPTLRDNLNQAKGGADSHTQTYDMVIGSDITYNKDAIEDLLDTLCDAEIVGAETEVIIGHLERGQEYGFWEMLADSGFDLMEVHKEDVAEGGVARALWVHVLKAVRRSGWEEEEEGMTSREEKDGGEVGEESKA